MSSTILSIENGHKQIGSSSILTQLTFAASKGEFIAILGPSGSGKTTLLRLLAGLDLWSAGAFQQDATIRSAFVFQEPNLLGWRTLLENTLLPLELTHQKPDIELAMESLRLVHLEHAAHLYPHELSGGMKMRASIARALVTKPDLLFFDEPFAALDEPTREELQEQLREIWNQQLCTILFVTHSIAEAVFLANRIVYLDGKPAKIQKDFSLQLERQRNSQTRSAMDYFREMKKVRELFQKSASAQTEESTL